MSKRKGLSSTTRFSIWRRDGFRCTYCGASADDAGVILEVDHIVAVAHGGTDAPSNLTTACKPCNARKGPTPWARSRAAAKVMSPVVLGPNRPIVGRNRVREVRKRQGLTVARLAKMSGVSKPTIFTIEGNQDYVPHGRIFLALSKALDETELFWMEWADATPVPANGWTPDALAYWGEWVGLLR